MFDRIKDNLPLASLLLLVICLVRVIVFYKVFGIAITDYLELGELLSLMSGYLLSQFIAIGLYTCLMIVISNQQTVSQTLSLFNIDVPISLLHNLRKIYFGSGAAKLCWWGAVTFSVCSVWQTYLKGAIDIYTISSWLIFFGAVFLDDFVIKHCVKFKRSGSDAAAEAHNKTLRTGIQTFCLMLLLLWGNFLWALSSGYYLKTIRNVDRVVIEYEGKFIRTSPNYLFVGRTKSFTFFYNRQTSRAHVYPNGGIKRIYIED
ncbi:hypothetical protein [Hymenobacter volaticus]|uniref:Uncharacterized protein n=1 Tax=Hymenobacter volaticus TaxID=2932254 RepID=A0ABY4G1X1_9BACT|nr:hypothetical protein [Hymenobacter volaticus]UOQ64870.1 hypothetical protein MUN86_15005 [Hymenobacter volaticus]